jgi:hypothetical protein
VIMALFGLSCSLLSELGPLVLPSKSGVTDMDGWSSIGSFGDCIMTEVFSPRFV